MPRRLTRRLVLIHWHPKAAEDRLATLSAAGFEAAELSPSGMPGLRPLRDDPPDIVVIDLDRRPADGREIAASLRRLKVTRHVPLVLAGGEPAKVDRTRSLLPDAVYTEWDRIAEAVHEGLAAPPREPVVPGTMDAYAGASLEQKLGVGGATRVVLLSPPEGFAIEAARVKQSGRGELVLLFVRSRAELKRRLERAFGAVEEGGSLWIAWPKRASGVTSDLTQVVVRGIGLDAGWVDYKVAALDETWSGLRFTRRRPSTRK